MGYSKYSLLGQDPLKLCPFTPGPTGMNDAASPDTPRDLLWDTPGSLGCNDHAAPEAHESLFGIGQLRFTLSWDRDLVLWDYDPDRLLDVPTLSPAFVDAAHRAMTAAVRMGLRPKVHDAYRTPEESDRKNKKYKAGKGGRASPAWQSVHNYGLAMDVYLYDAKRGYIDNHVKGWYAQYKLLATATSANGFVWGEPFDDADHFEYHPNWSKGAGGAFLGKVKVWAEQAAAWNAKLPDGQEGPVDEPTPDAWMPYFWWAAGAGGSSPPKDFTAEHSPPTQGK